MVLIQTSAYKEEIIEKAKLSEDDFNALMKTIFSYISIIPQEIYLEYMKDAKAIMFHIDPDDVVYAAASICIENSSIWSDDKDWNKQNNIKIFTTPEVIKILE